jgi:predicted transcriptional regulator
MVDVVLGPGDGLMKTRLLRGFKTPQQLLMTSIGELERRLLDVVWSRGKATVREVHTKIDGDVAYTTVMTTLDRLYRKGLLHRRKAGRAFEYTAEQSSAEVERAALADLLRASVERESAALRSLLSSLVEAISAKDRLLLDELEELVKEQRRRLSGT